MPLFYSSLLETQVNPSLVLVQDATRGGPGESDPRGGRLTRCEGGEGSANQEGPAEYPAWFPPDSRWSRAARADALAPARASRRTNHLLSPSPNRGLAAVAVTGRARTRLGHPRGARPLSSVREAGSAPPSCPAGAAVVDGGRGLTRASRSVRGHWPLCPAWCRQLSPPVSVAPLPTPTTTTTTIATSTSRLTLASPLPRSPPLLALGVRCLRKMARPRPPPAPGRGAPTGSPST